MNDLTPPTLDNLNETDALAHIQRIRDVRMCVVQQLREAEEAARRVAEERLAAKINKQCDMLRKELARLDALIDKCTDRVDKIRALRLEGDVL